jgi:hypothetical protein
MPAGVVSRILNPGRGTGTRQAGPSFSLSQSAIAAVTDRAAEQIPHASATDPYSGDLEATSRFSHADPSHACKSLIASIVAQSNPLDRYAHAHHTPSSRCLQTNQLHKPSNNGQVTCCAAGTNKLRRSLVWPSKLRFEASRNSRYSHPAFPEDWRDPLAGGHCLAKDRSSFTNLDALLSLAASLP